MATYASTTQLQNAIGGNDSLAWISDLLNVSVDSNAVTSALEYGTSLIDTYANGTPNTLGIEGAMWATTPTRAVQCCIDAAIFVLYLRIRRDVPDNIQALYDKWIKELERMNEGKVSWVVAEPPATANTGNVFYFGAGSTARTDNPRRTLRTSLDLL
jgi:phage gp36-like protein